MRIDDQEYEMALALLYGGKSFSESFFVFWVPMGPLSSGLQTSKTLGMIWKWLEQGFHLPSPVMALPDS